MKVSESTNIEIDDRQLIKMALSDDPDGAKRALYEKYVHRVYWQGRSYNGIGHEDAEDIIQDVFISVFTKLSDLKEHDKFQPWLKSIVRNRSLQLLNDKLRRRSAQKGYEAEHFLHMNSPDEYLKMEKEIQIVHKLISSIDNKDHRETIELFYIKGFSCEDISKTQDITVSSVTTRLSRFRARIQREMIRLILEIESGNE